MLLIISDLTYRREAKYEFFVAPSVLIFPENFRIQASDIFIWSVKYVIKHPMQKSISKFKNIIPLLQIYLPLLSQ